MPLFRLRGRRLLALVGLLGITFLWTTKPSIPSSPPTQLFTSWQEYHSNRSLALVHIGKAGGLTLRAMTSLKCRLPRKQVTPETIQDCLMATYGTTQASQHPLALQTMYYAHMRSIPVPEMKAATSWLIVLRNPMERIISAYLYSHPGTCRDTNQLLVNSTKACTNYFMLQRPGDFSRKSKSQVRTEHQLAQLFVECFPHADMEGFVSSALLTTTPNSTTTTTCAQLARSYLLGQGPIFPIPHFFYNYQHYQSKVLDTYTANKKEWFGIRTEHLWEDFAALNQQLGGTSAQAGVKLTHGSEGIESSAKILSTASYHGLCCLLVDELAIYLQLVQKMWNWNATTKANTFRELAMPCGMIHEDDDATSRKWDDLWILWRKWKSHTCGVTTISLGGGNLG